MREFDNDQKIALYSQIIGTAIALAILFVSYNFITSNLPEKLLSVCRNIFIGLMSFNILVVAMQIYRYKKSELNRIEKMIKHCKKNHISFDKINTGECGLKKEATTRSVH